MNAGGDVAVQILEASVESPGDALAAAEGAREHTGAEVRVDALVEGEVFPLEWSVERIELAGDEGDPERLGGLRLELDLVAELPTCGRDRDEVDRSAEARNLLNPLRIALGVLGQIGVPETED